MSLNDLAALGSFVSGVAVLISLVFLYFQLRQVNAQVQQNTRHMSAQLWQAASDRGVNMMIAMADKDLAAAYIVGNGGVATPEAIQNAQFGRQVFAFYQIAVGEMFQQADEGLISPQRLSRIRSHTLELLKREPGSRRVLSDMIAANAALNDPFNAYLKQMIAEAEA